MEIDGKSIMPYMETPVSDYREVEIMSPSRLACHPAAGKSGLEYTVFAESETQDTIWILSP